MTEIFGSVSQKVAPLLLRTIVPCSISYCTNNLVLYDWL